MLRPTSNASDAVCVSCPRCISAIRCWKPLARLAPLVSSARLNATGLVSGELAGDIASTSVRIANAIWVFWCASTGILSTAVIIASAMML